MSKQSILFEEYKFPNRSNESNYFDETQAWQNIKQLVHGFPDESEELLPGVKWGCYSQLYTPAFWKFQYSMFDFSMGDDIHRLSSNIIEEIVMCVLGGYGIPSEMGIIAFERLKELDLIKEAVSYESIYQALSDPFSNSIGKQIHYRFFNQKSKYIYKFLNRNDLGSIPVVNDLDLRNWLLTVDGIGLKTASWITRNWLKSNNVAILDIHLLRAGKLAGFFDESISPTFNYLSLERKYLEFCNALDVDASNMDAIIWYFMKKNAKLAIKHYSLKI